MVRILPLATLLLLSTAIQVSSAFNPPRIMKVVRLGRDTGDSATGPVSEGRVYYIDRGTDANIKIGNVLNVYRQKAIPIGPSKTQPLRVFMGTMKITASQEGISVGQFKPDLLIASNAMIRYKMAMKGDTVVPKLKLDSSLLFQAGQTSLSGAALQELEDVAKFVKSFTPSKLIIEGHTDSDGAEDANQKLSEERAQLIKDHLINTYEFITGGMVEAQGYGEARPLVNNDTPKNKALNRRIEIVVWE